MQSAEFPMSRDAAAAFDKVDPLVSARSKFVVAQDVTYLVGHSLGPPTQRALDRLRDAGEVEWSGGLVGSWNTAGWIDLPSTVGAQIAGLIGVGPKDVIVCDSVSINLFKLVGALMDAPGMDITGMAAKGLSKRIIVEAGEFPTDQYILERLAQIVGAEFVRAEPGTGPEHLKTGSVFVRSLVDYRTAAIADVRGIEDQAQKRGGAVVWDLSHATGVVDLKLADWGVKYAVGCTYKYLNGGPGAPAFIYVDRDHVGALDTPLAGWLGHARPFAFENDYEPRDGVARFVAGTPPILTMSALAGALDVFDGVSLGDVEDKAQRLGDMCLAAFSKLGLPSLSPPIGTRRGGHVSLSHPDGYAVSRALAERGFKTDFRPPTTIRFGLSPLFLSYVEVWSALEALEDILKTHAYREPRFSVRAKVT